MDIKRENGSSAIFVLIGMLFMTAFLIITYGNLSNKSKVMSEQYHIINGIYSSGGSTDEIAYEAAYTTLRSKNKQILTIDRPGENSESTTSIELEKPYAGYVKNYKIYGSASGVGDYIGIDEDGTSIYQIPVRVWKKEDDANRTELNKGDYYTDYYINIRTESSLNVDDYIEYRTLTLTRSTEIEEDIGYNDYIPQIPTYEDYTKIEILSTNAPARVVIEYSGYTL